MNAEQLISMAAARGIDLVAAAQQSTDLPRRDTVMKMRLGVRITQLCEQPEMRAYGRETPSLVEPEWSTADIGLALAGVGRIQTLAALFAWAGDRQHYWPLVTELRTVAMGLRRREHWPEAIIAHTGAPIEYVERLCQMVLFEDSYPGVLDAAPNASIGQEDQAGILRAVFCDTTLAIWKRHLSSPYMRINGVWLDWLDHAARAAQSRLSEE